MANIRTFYQDSQHTALLSGNKLRATIKTRRECPFLWIEIDFLLSTKVGIFFPSRFPTATTHSHGVRVPLGHTSAVSDTTITQRSPPGKGQHQREIILVQLKSSSHFQLDFLPFEIQT